MSPTKINLGEKPRLQNQLLHMMLLKHVSQFHMDIENANGFEIGLSVSKRKESHFPFEPKKQ